MFEEEAEEYWNDSGSNEFDIGQVEKACKQSFIDGANFGYIKANEWHKVADGDLPKEGTVCLTARTIISGNVAYDVCSYYEGLFGENWFAWKEIVLPKEIKEND